MTVVLGSEHNNLLVFLLPFPNSIAFVPPVCTIFSKLFFYKTTPHQLIPVFERWNITNTDKLGRLSRKIYLYSHKLAVSHVRSCVLGEWLRASCTHYGILLTKGGCVLQFCQRQGTYWQCFLLSARLFQPVRLKLLF